MAVPLSTLRLSDPGILDGNASQRSTLHSRGINLRIINSCSAHLMREVSALGTRNGVSLGSKTGEQFKHTDLQPGGFPVSRLHQVEWSDDPFQSLVIGTKQKTLIHSLVKQHSLNTGYDDVVQGKGLGLIGLLSGNPGCGKTLTAEAVAEVTKRPLYPVSAGELGTEPEKVDKQLTAILDISHRWSAILLLDEADVFLQERDAKDVARNALVSIFLRQLEYYQGIMILTTNRIGDCDPAFESMESTEMSSYEYSANRYSRTGRIHFSIHYPDLDVEARRLIWKTFISRAHSSAGTEASFKDEEMEELAKHEMNGRQVSPYPNSTLGT